VAVEGKGEKLKKRNKSSQKRKEKFACETENA
jgi:hypothetical protein